MVGAWKNVVASRTSIGTDTAGSINGFFGDALVEPDSSDICSDRGSSGVMALSVFNSRTSEDNCAKVELLLTLCQPPEHPWYLTVLQFVTVPHLT